ATATRADVLAAGRAALVDEFAQTLPLGYDTPLGESGVRLSGGQRRRGAIARAPVSNAPPVLLGEPTASLHPAATPDRVVPLDPSAPPEGGDLHGRSHSVAAAAPRARWTQAHADPHPHAHPYAGLS